MKTLSVLACSLLLAACAGTAEPTRYYQLPDSAFRLPERSGRSVALKVVLSQALGSPSLLYQTDAQQLHFAQNHLWASPLDEALAAALANKLNRYGSSNYLPAKLAADGSPTATVYLDRFQGSYRGETEISGYIRYADGSSQAFQVAVPQQGDGYAAMTESLNQGLEQLARQIAR